MSSPLILMNRHLNKSSGGVKPRGISAPTVVCLDLQFQSGLFSLCLEKGCSEQKDYWLKGQDRFAQNWPQWKRPDCEVYIWSVVAHHMLGCVGSWWLWLHPVTKTCVTHCILWVCTDLSWATSHTTTVVVFSTAFFSRWWRLITSRCTVLEFYYFNTATLADFYYLSTPSKQTHTLYVYMTLKKTDLFP